MGKYIATVAAARVRHINETTPLVREFILLGECPEKFGWSRVQFPVVALRSLFCTSALGSLPLYPFPYHMDMVSVIIGTRKGTKFYISIFNYPLATRESREVLKRKLNLKINII